MCWWRVCGGSHAYKIDNIYIKVVGRALVLFFSLTNQSLHTLCKHAIHVTIKIKKFLFSPSFVVR